MPRTTCFWTRKLELELVNFVRPREFIWKPMGNTNHHIEQKYKAYAEFAAKLGRGFTARSVRDRWVNIRSTFNHNWRKVERSRLAAVTEADVYVPCWPLWKPLQFLKEKGKVENGDNNYTITTFEEPIVKNEAYDDSCLEIQDLSEDIGIRQRGIRTDRPRHRVTKHKPSKCIKVLDNLIKALKPLKVQHGSFYFFGKHVTERLNCMREIDAECARREIMSLIEEMEDVT